MSNARDKANIPALNFSSTGIDDNATSTAITIDSSERVGIGITSPLDQLSVLSSGIGKVRFAPASGSVSNLLLSGLTTGDSGFQFNSNQLNMFTYGDIAFFPSTSNISGSYPNGEVMRIRNNGNVGIGTTSPQKTFVVSNSGAEGYEISPTDVSAVIRQIAYNRNTSTFNTLRTQASQHHFYIGDVEKARLDASGRVGVGTDSPDHLIHISANSTNTQLKLQRTGSATASFNIAASSDSLAFSDQAASTERMRITSTGLGVGTSSPGAKLHIYKGSSGGSINTSTDDLVIESNTTCGINILTNAAAGGNAVIYFGDEADNNVGGFIYNNATNYLETRVNGSEVMRINSSGSVSIGTTVATATLNVLADSGSEGIDVLGRSSDNRSRIQLNSNDGSTVYSQWDYSGATVELKAVANVPLVFRTNNTERMRITETGRFGMNGRTNPQYTLEFGDSGTGNGWSINAENNVHKIRTRASAGDTQTHIQWENTNGIVGTIKTNGSATQYNTSSDYRLKENVDYNFDATTRLKQLKPARFNFIADADTTVDGFLAHEVSSVVPEAISGEKDAVDEDGNPEYQGIDQSKLVPLLVKTIQELEARITTLEANNP